MPNDDRKSEVILPEQIKPVVANELRSMAAGPSLAFRAYLVQKRRKNRKRANESESEE